MVREVKVYHYKARDRRGQLIEGAIEATDVRKAVEELRNKGLYIIKIGEPGRGLQQEVRLPSLRPGVTLKDIAILSRQLATMLQAGVPLVQALALTEEQASKKAVAELVRGVREDIQEGGSFTEAVRKRRRFFPPLFISLVQSGEASGDLDGSLDRLANYLEKELAIRGKVRSAMTYPTLVFVFAILVSYGLVAFIVPQFASILLDLGGELPLLTRFLLFVSDLSRKALPGILLALALLPWAFRVANRIPALRKSIDWSKLKAPVFGPLISKNVLASTLRTLATLQRSGVPVLEALSILMETSNNVHVQRVFQKTYETVERGGALSEGLKTAPHLIPGMVSSMLAIGEETGNVEEMADKVAQYYEREVEDTIASLSSIIEPLLIIFLGAVVGFVVLAMFMPLVQMIQTLSTQ